MDILSFFAKTYDEAVGEFAREKARHKIKGGKGQWGKDA